MQQNNNYTIREECTYYVKHYQIAILIFNMLTRILTRNLKQLEALLVQKIFFLILHCTA